MGLSKETLLTYHGTGRESIWPTSFTIVITDECYYMRIDLTQGAFRVLKRSERFPDLDRGVSVLSVLFSLFAEPESRAYSWLHEIPITLLELKEHLGMISGDETVFESVAEPVSDDEQVHTLSGQKLVTSLENESAYNVQKQDVEEEHEEVQHGVKEQQVGEEHTEKQHTEKYSVDEQHAEKQDVAKQTLGERLLEQIPVQDRAELFKKQHVFYGPPVPKPGLAGKKSPSFLHWFLNEQPVRLDRVHPDFESALYVLLNRVRKKSEVLDTSLVYGPGNSVVKIKPNYDLGFVEPTFQIATEHLLLAVVLAEDALGIGRWLRNKGLDPLRLYEKIENLYKVSEPVSYFNPDPPDSAEKEQTKDETASFAVSDEHENEEGEPVEPDKEVAFSFSLDQSIDNDPNGFVGRSEQRNLFRILDASANRAQEAVRVIEDYVRFGLDDSDLTGRLKNFRHELTRLLRLLPEKDRLQARDTEEDVGTVIQGPGEYQRRDLKEVLASNFSRLQESLRSLEEFAKIISIPLAQGLEQLRYHSYSFQKAIVLCGQQHEGNLTSEKPNERSNEKSNVERNEGPNGGTEWGQKLRDRLNESQLYVLVDTRESEEEFCELVQTLIEAGVDLLQLRDKRAEDRHLLSRGLLLRKMTARTNTLFIMNDRVDLALLCDADGVHFGQEELTVQEGRRILGGEKLIGRSTHNLEQVRNAMLEGTDYIGIGPVFPSWTKSFETFPGLDFIRAVNTEIAELTCPAFAIGGITLENLEQVRATGQFRIAISSPILGATNPREIVEQFKQKLSVPPV
ncbi:MAG: thiamine phosphate synthase [Thermoguttaceae bacterium]